MTKNMVNNGFPKQNNLHLTEQMGFARLSGVRCRFYCDAAPFASNGCCQVYHPGVG
jgi:hypothetical protein